MKMPKTVWNYSKRTEALRVLNTSDSIKSHFFEKKGFFILPYNVTNNSKCVYFPNLNYNSIPHFWEIARTFAQQLEEQNHPIISEIEKRLPNEPLDFSKEQKEWQKMEKPFWNMVCLLFADYFKGVKTLEIRPTRYGTIGTGYSGLMKVDPTKIIIYIRIDGGMQHIAKCIFLDKVYQRMRKMEDQFTWEEAMAVLDFLIRGTSFSKYFPKFRSVLGDIRQKQQGKLAQNSQEYMGTLGLPTGEIFNIKEEAIHMFKKPLSVRFTPAEDKIMRILISNKKKVVTYDNLAEALWGKESFEKFSLYSITKAMQRVREKISGMGIFPEIIQAVKKEGYILVD